MQPITAIAEKAGIDDKYLEQYGKYKAKIDYNLLKTPMRRMETDPRYSQSTRHRQEKGKTTTSVGSGRRTFQNR